MGSKVGGTDYSDADRVAFSARVAQCLEVLEDMLAGAAFDHAHPRAGLEIEINLVDEHGAPAPRNAEVLAAIDDPSFVPELCQFNIELNLSPRQLGPGGVLTFEHVIRSALNDAYARASRLGVQLAVIGALPTARPEHVTRETLTAHPRYAQLDEQVTKLRQGDVDLTIDGPEPLTMTWSSIAPEALCTSMQIHLQVSPKEFPGFWNASQAIAGVQVAMGANSPFVFGHRLAAESRIILFEQATDTRTQDQRVAGITPRVFFGEDWIGSALDLFRANQRYAPLLPELSEEDPHATRAAGGVPALAELNLHNGTIWRWNRPVYDRSGGGPHLRVENRVLPAGPTAIDMMANTALYAGLTKALAERAAALWPDEPFEWARSNFDAGVRQGIDAVLRWPGHGERPARKLVAEVLLPLAASGLQAYDVQPADIERYLGVIEGRCQTGQNGATWQTAEVAAREEAGMDRNEALGSMMRAYLKRMHRNQPVHTWPIFPASEEEPS